MISLTRTEPKNVQPTPEELINELSNQVLDLTQQVQTLTSKVADLENQIQAKPLI